MENLAFYVVGRQLYYGTILAEEAGVHGVLHSQGRVVSVKAGEQPGRKASGIYAGIDGCVPGGAAAGAFINQPYIQVLSLGIDPELSGAYEFLSGIAFFTVSHRSRRPVILYGPFDVFHIVFLSCLSGGARVLRAVKSVTS